jgi:serine/threonine protein kinase/formylglycine-generating enzyme required for sulfatase activity
VTQNDRTDSAPSAPAPFSADQKLAGVYVLRRQISPEGAALIWLAYDEVLGKDVSLHFLPAEVRGDTRAMNELRHEIKRNRQLIHPNILRVYDLIEEADWVAISMDAFEGDSVAVTLSRKESGFFEPADVKPLLQQLCQTLEDVHKVQIVHRNISPVNLIVEQSGKLLVVNFGISRVIEDALGRLRRKGEGAERHLVYMSPQQLDGETPNRADDIYSVGITIYELLTGGAPFTGDDLVPQIRKTAPQPMMERRARLGRRGGTILPTWEKAVAACLAKNPADRPQSAAELAGKLGLSGKLSAGETASIAAAAAPKQEKEKTEPAKKVETSAKSSGKKSAPAVEKSAGKTGAAGVDPALAGAVQAELQGDPKKKTEEPKSAVASPVDLAVEDAGVPDIYPSLYPRRSKFPLTGVAAAVVLAGIGLSAYYLSQQGQEAASGDNEPTAHVGDHGELALVNNSSPAPTAEPVSALPATSPDLLLVQENSAAGGAASVATEAPAPATPETPARAVTAPAAPPAPTPVIASEAAGAERGENRLAANNRKSKDAKDAKDAKGAPSSPLPAAPATAPASGSDAGALPVSDAALTAKQEAVEKARRAVDAAEKARQDAIKLQQQAEAARADAMKAVEDRKKALAPAMKGAEEIDTQRTQREEELKAAELAAQQARQLAEEKVRKAEEARKALTDWEAQNKPKLAARDKAASELQSLQQSVTEKERIAAEAAAAAMAANQAKEQQFAALQKAEQEAEQIRLAVQKAAEEAARKAAEARAAERARLAQEMDGIEKMRRELEERMAELKRRLENPGAAAPAPAPAPAPVPAPSSPTATPPAPAGADAAPAGAAPAATLAMRTPATTPAIPAPEPAPDAPVAKPADAANAFENSLGMRFLPVPGTEASFCVWPTRLRDFEAFAKETNLKSTAWRAPGFKQGPDHPVVNVSWNDAMAFCKWLTDRDKKRNVLPNGQTYRLPTDVEWSKAVGLPEETGNTPEARDMNVPDVFPWGTQWPPPSNAGNYTGEETGSDVAIKGFDDGFTWTSPVGSFPANKFGLHDMGGNVWQWCMDNKNASSQAKVLRGASWYNGALKLSLLSSCRGYANPDNSADNYGFRVVLAKGESSARGSRR